MIARPIARRRPFLTASRFGVPVLSVITVLSVSCWIEPHHTGIPVSLFLCAIALNAWFGGAAPGLLAVALSALTFNYFCLGAGLTFSLGVADAPLFLSFLLSSLFIAALGAAQNAAGKRLGRARDKLADALGKLEETNHTLRLEAAECRKVHEELKCSEAFLTQGQKISHTGSWRWNPSSGKLIWSDEHFRIYGYQPGPEPPPLAQIGLRIHNDDREELQRVVRQAIKDWTHFECEYRLVLPDGTLRYVHGVGYPVPEAHCPKEFIGTTVDITVRRKAEEQLRQLAGRMEAVREEERKHLARELHDELAQHLLSARMRVRLLEREFGMQLPALAARTQDIIGIVDSSVDTVRSVVAALRPAELDLCILSALQRLAGEFTAQTGIPCKLHRGTEDIAVPEEIAIAIYRIAQEALRNVAKHARADRVDVSFRRDAGLHVLEVRDNGVGFDPSTKKDLSFGLVGIRERVLMLDGQVDITTAPGEGTNIHVRFPAPIHQ